MYLVRHMVVEFEIEDPAEELELGIWNEKLEWRIASAATVEC